MSSGRTTGKRVWRTLERERLTKELLKLRTGPEALTLLEAASKLGISRTTAFRWEHRAMRMAADTTIEEARIHRADIQARLDRLIAAHWAPATDKVDPCPKSAKVVLDALNARRAMWGTDAPAKVEVAGAVGDVGPEMAARLVREMFGERVARPVETNEPSDQPRAEAGDAAACVPGAREIPEGSG